MDPDLGIFTQADTLDPLEPGVGTNRYAYALNNPVLFRDPSGNAAGVGHNSRRDDDGISNSAYPEPFTSDVTIFEAGPGSTRDPLRVGGLLMGAAGEIISAVNRSATNNGRFSGVTPKNAEEAAFIRNAEATFGDSKTWTQIRRVNGELVIQRTDIEFSPQNVLSMKNGRAPFVRNSNGEWEKINLHHIGRQRGKLIEVTESQNTYNSVTGGPLHIVGSGSPTRQDTRVYWKQRYQELVDSGQIIE